MSLGTMIQYARKTMIAMELVNVIDIRMKKSCLVYVSASNDFVEKTMILVLEVAFLAKNAAMEFVVQQFIMKTILHCLVVMTKSAKNLDWKVFAAKVGEKLALIFVAKRINC